ncbi:flagellar biosynthesis protein FlgN [Buchnera aphidicola]|uniref:flagellar biosynthesis protein FlgN n=1 Tax=Buchnera aphidicola TaxID=9 RepID=UPI003CE5A108
MKKLINILKKIEKILCSIEILLNRENIILLNISNNIHLLESIIKKKEKLFKEYFIANQEKLLFEKKNSIFLPYKDEELNHYIKQMNKKCILLRNLNRQNKIIMNKNFYLNQKFLELFGVHEISIINNTKIDLKI